MLVFRLFATAAVIFLAAPYLSYSQRQPETCRVEIVNPKNGDSVGNDGDVIGTVVLPAGKHLWVFAHRRGFALWWPQGGGPADVTNGKWIVVATYGLDRDRGSQFEVAGVVLDEKENKEMLNLVRRYEERGDYPGVRMPPGAEGCPVAKIVVKRQ